jgi:hypothetical protein
MVKRGTSQLQNSDGHFPEDESGRSLAKHWLEKKFQNGEKVHCTWMCFSPKNGALFCFCCSLFNEQFTEFRNNCTFLAQRYLKDLNRLEMYQDYKDIML